MQSPVKSIKEKIFTCQLCGECCCAWNLPIDNILYEKLIKIDWIVKLLNENNLNFNLIDNQIYIPKKDGICIFLAQNKLCMLHNDLKPNECKRFPFAIALDKTNNIYLDTSFFCKSIVNSTGEIVSDSVKEYLVSNFDFFNFPDKISFSRNVLVNNELYKEIIDKLLTFLYFELIETDIHTWGNVLFKGFELLKTMERTLKQKKSIANINEKNLDNCKISSVDLKLHIITSFLVRKKYPVKDLISLLISLGIVNDLVTDENINVNKLKLIKIEGIQQTKHQLIRYYLNILQRQILICHGYNLINIYCFIIAAYCLNMWYMRVLIYIENKAFIDTNLSKDKQLSFKLDQFYSESAIRITERYYIGHNAKFLEVLTHYIDDFM